MACEAALGTEQLATEAASRPPTPWVATQARRGALVHYFAATVNPAMIASTSAASGTAWFARLVTVS
jgi:hypothetical protein